MEVLLRGRSFKPKAKHGGEQMVAKQPLSQLTNLYNCISLHCIVIVSHQLTNHANTRVICRILLGLNDSPDTSKDWMEELH